MASKWPLDSKQSASDSRNIYSELSHFSLPLEINHWTKQYYFLESHSIFQSIFHLYPSVPYNLKSTEPNNQNCGPINILPHLTIIIITEVKRMCNCFARCCLEGGVRFFPYENSQHIWDSSWRLEGAPLQHFAQSHHHHHRYTIRIFIIIIHHDDDDAGDFVILGPWQHVACKLFLADTTSPSPHVL